MSKIKYDANQDYQVDALNSIIDLLDGALAGTPTVTTITDSSEAKIIPLETNILGNSLAISDEKLLENLNAVQERNDLPLSPSLESREFSIEMETGTGKTYVYTSAIHKLHADYGLTKFIIIVPSIAIKEGTYNSILETNDHFAAQYNQKLSPFIYDSTKLDQVKEFIEDSEIQVMIMTIGSFNKKGKNVWYQEKEELNYSKPVELVKRTRPVVIIDEPQSVEGGVYGKGKEGLDELDALFTIRLSATLPELELKYEKAQLIYELNPIDAYNLELVKGIEVDSPELSGGESAYIELIDVESSKEGIRAKVRLNKKNDEGITTCEETVSKDQDLAKLTKIKLYSTVKIERVSKRKGRLPMLVLSLENGEKKSLTPGESVGGIDEKEMVRAMMKKIIQNHLDKQNLLKGQNIKVLSLFFIDQVSKYRIYDESGQQKDDAEYVVMFEELMQGFAKESEYEELFIDSDTGNPIDIKDMHEGYFSIDPKGKWVDTSLTNQKGKENASRAFNLIIRGKKQLIDPENPVGFIFSHSALNEGWDVPNIFQISVLRDIKSTMTKRQTIGRGMRLCRKKNGDEFERVRDPDINILTVTAKQNFEKWAGELQHEYERTGITFGIITKKVFSSKLVEDLKKKGHLDSEGKPTDTFESYVNSEQFDAKGGDEKKVRKKLLKVSKQKKVPAKKSRPKKTPKLQTKVLENEKFKNLWDAISPLTRFRCTVTDVAMKECIKELNKMNAPSTSSIEWTANELTMSQEEGLEGAIIDESVDDLTITYPIPDLIGMLERSTGLLRSTIFKILTECDPKVLEYIRDSPTYSIGWIGKTIAMTRAKYLSDVDLIDYSLLEEDQRYPISMFEDSLTPRKVERTIDTKKNCKCPFDFLSWESEPEKNFIKECIDKKEVLVFTKLPFAYKIPIPSHNDLDSLIGTYNPDFALIYKLDGGEYFCVVETKSSNMSGKLRDSENAKIQVAKKHYRTLRSSQQKLHFIGPCNNFKEVRAHLKKKCDC